MAGRINVDTVIELVSDDVHAAIRRLTIDERQPARAADGVLARRHADRRLRGAATCSISTQSGLADWAAEHTTAIRLLVRPGDYVFPGAPIAPADRPGAKARDAAIRAATALGSERGPARPTWSIAVRQLVEVAVRALSPGINDPHTAISVLDRLGAALCDLVPLHLPTGVHGRATAASCWWCPHVDYDGLVDAMFHMIRQNAAGSAAVLIRMLEVLTAVASCERDARRGAALQRHADLVLGDARRQIATPGDLADIEHRHDEFMRMLRDGPGALAAARD